MQHRVYHVLSYQARAWNETRIYHLQTILLSVIEADDRILRLVRLASAKVVLTQQIITATITDI